MPLIRRKYVQSIEEVPLPNGHYSGHTRSRYATIDHNNQQYKFDLDRVLFAKGYEMPTKFTVYNKTAYIGEIPLNFFSVNDTISNKVQVEKTNVNIGDLLKLKWSFISKLEKNPDWAAVASKLQKEVIVTEPTQDPNVFICKFLKALKPVSVDLKKDVDWEDSQFTEYDKKYYRNKFESYLKTELPDYLREDKDPYFGLDSRDFSNITLNPTSDAARNLKPNDEFFITPKEDLRLDYGNVLLKNDKYRVKEIPDTKGGLRLRFVGGAVNKVYISKNQFESRFGGKYIRTELPKVAEKADKSGVHLSTSYQRRKYETMARVAKFKLIGYRLEEDRGKNGVFVDYICEIEKNPDKYAIIHPDGNYEIAYKENTRNIIPIGVPLQESKLFIENIQAMKKLSELLLTEAEIAEKAVSKKQQKFFGMVHAAQTGEKPASPEVAKVAKNISKSNAEDFASTKHKGLPEKSAKSLKESDAYTDAYGGGNQTFSFFVVGEDGTEFTVDGEGMDINDAYEKVSADYPDANSIRLSDSSMGGERQRGRVYGDLDEVSTGLINRARIGAVDTANKEYNQKYPQGSAYGTNTPLGDRKQAQASAFADYGHNNNANAKPGEYFDTTNPKPVNYQPRLEENWIKGLKKRRIIAEGHEKKHWLKGRSIEQLERVGADSDTVLQWCYFNYPTREALAQFLVQGIDRLDYETMRPLVDDALSAIGEDPDHPTYDAIGMGETLKMHPEVAQKVAEEIYDYNRSVLGYDKSVSEGDFGEVDNGMYAGNTVSGAFSAKNTPQHAPVMETNVNELSTGLASKAYSAAYSKAHTTSDVTDPIGKEKAGDQARNFGSYINPDLVAFLKSKNINVRSHQIGGMLIIDVPAAVGTDRVQIEVGRKHYDFTYGNAQQLGSDMLRILPNIIKRVQADLVLPQTPAPPAPNELEESSNVAKKIRYKMTEDQKKMFDELRMIKESMRKLDGNKQLLY
jgi:hypothetical protein